MGIPVRMPGKGAYYTPRYRDKTSKVTHFTLTTRRNFKRTPWSRAICGPSLTGMWPRPMGAITCSRCLRAYDALIELLREDDAK